MELATDIFDAAKSGDVSGTQALLERTPSLVHLRGDHQWTPLHCAAYQGNVKIAEMLIRNGASLMARSRGDQATPLHWAAEAGHREMVGLLLRHGADVNATDDLHGRGALGWSVMFDETHFDVASLLLVKGAEIDIFSAVALNRHDAVKALVRGSRQRALSNEYAAALGKDRAIRTMVRTDPKVLSARMSRINDGRMPLHLAVLKNLPGMVGLLIDCGADIHGQTLSGRTALCLAAENERNEIVDLLLEKGARVDPQAAQALGQMDRASVLLGADRWGAEKEDHHPAPSPVLMRNAA